jgi:hypothetical protein
MPRHMYRLPILVAVVALLLTAPAVWAGDRGRDRDEADEIPFDEAEIFFELNDTDGDLGIHALIDGDAWKSLQFKDIGLPRCGSRSARRYGPRAGGARRKTGVARSVGSNPARSKLRPANPRSMVPGGMPGRCIPEHIVGIRSVRERLVRRRRRYATSRSGSASRFG